MNSSNQRKEIYGEQYRPESKLSNEMPQEKFEQQNEDWMDSSNQRKEIYGEQYRPERKLSEELPQEKFEQQNEDWMDSSNQRKEIYGEQYRPERRLSGKLPQETFEQQDKTEQQHEDWMDSSNQRKEIYGGQYRPERKLSDEISQEKTEQQDETEQHHIERTWSTEKIVETSSTSEEDHATKTSQEQPLSTPYEAHQKLNTDETIVHSPYKSEHEEEDQHSDQFIIETPQKDENQLQQKLITNEIIAKPSEIIQHEDQYEKTASNEESVIIPHEEFERRRSETEDEYRLEQKLTSEKIDIGSPQLSEHEDEDEVPRHKTERQPSADQIVVESSQATQHNEDQYERPPSDKETVITSHEKLDRKRSDTEDEYELERRLSSDKVSIKSPQPSEHEEEKSKSEQQQSFEKVGTESPNLSEHEEDQHQQKLSTDSSSIQFSKKTEEEKYDEQDEGNVIIETSPKAEEDTSKQDDQGKSGRKSSTFKFAVASAPSSEEEEKKIHEHRQEVNVGSSKTLDEESEKTPETFEQKYHEQHQQEKDQHTSITESSPETKDKFERKLSAEEINVESSQESEHEEEEKHREDRVTTTHLSDEEEQYQPERKQSDEQLSTSQQVPMTSHEKIEEERPSAENEFKLERKLSDEEIVTERKSDSEKIITESSHLSEQEEEEHREDRITTTHLSDEEEQYQPERKQSDEQPSSSQKVPITSHEEIEEERPREENEFKLERKLSDKQVVTESPQLSEHEEEPAQEYHYEDDRKSDSEKIITESPHLSEKEVDEQQNNQDILESSQKIEEDTEEPYQSEQIRSTNQVMTEPSETIEQPKEEDSQYDRLLNSGQVTLTFPDQIEEDQHKPTETPQQSQYPYESTQSQDESLTSGSSQNFQRDISNDSFANLESSSFREEDESENEQLKRPQEWKQSSFQRDEIYGNKHRPAKYTMESSETEIQSKPTELESPMISHVQRSNVISRTIPSYPDEEEVEEQEESDFRPTHLDISSIPNDSDQNLSKILSSDTENILSPSDEQTSDQSNQYEKLLTQTSNNMVQQILHDAVKETTEQEQNHLLHETATDIVNDVMDDVYSKYDDEMISLQREEATSADVSISDLTDWSSLVKTVPDVVIQEKPTTSSDSDNGEEKIKDEYLPSDDEAKEKMIPQILDQPYISASDVTAPKSTQEFNDLVQDLHTLEQQINENVDIVRSSSPSSASSASENDEIHHYDLTVPQITTTAANELTSPVSELRTIHEQFEDKLDSSLQQKQDSPTAAKSTELKDRSQQQDDITQSADMDTLSRDIIKYRRDSQSNPPDNYSHRTERRPSSPPTSPLLEKEFVHITCSSMNDVDQVQQQLQDEQEETKLLQDMIDTIIKEAQENIQADVSIIFLHNFKNKKNLSFFSHQMFHNHLLNLFQQ